MSTYEFKEITAEETRGFFDTHPEGSFAQSPEMAEVRKDSGRKVHFLAVYEGKKIVAACQLSIISGRFVSADCTAGPLIDYKNQDLLRYFTHHIREFCARHGCVYVTIAPNSEYDTEVVNSLRNLGWEYSGRINASSVGIRGGIRWLYVKDLAGQTVENYRSSYAKRHHRYIRNADPNVKIRSLGREELESFYTIMQHTAERRDFATRKLDYFYSLYDRFGDKATFLVAELQEDGKTTPFAGIVFIEQNGEMVSYLGGALSDYAKYRGPYLLHDAMIKKAIEKGYHQYNFYGIDGNIDNPEAEGYGVYIFKTRFGTGRPVELIGEFVLPINTLKYLLFKLLRRL